MKANVELKLISRSDAYNKVRGSDWWLQDFFRRNTADLLASSNEKLKRRGQERLQLEKYLEPAIKQHLAFGSLEKIRSFFEPGFHADSEPIRLSDEMWHLATRAGSIPRFEPDWLAEIKNDPMCKLQMLKSPDASRQVLIETACFDIEKLETTELLERAKYMSESIAQAEQYLLAANNVQLRVRPLLLYYAATSLIRAMLVPRMQDLIGKYGSHGLEQDIDHAAVTTPMTNFHRFRVRTTNAGLFTALSIGFSERVIKPEEGPWSYMQLMTMIPELSDTLNQYTRIKGKCAKIANFHEHTETSRASNAYPHLAVSSSFLSARGFDPEKMIASSAIFEYLKKEFPGCIDCYRPLESAHDPYLKRGQSFILNEEITSIVYHLRSRKSYRNLYPLLFDGGTDGNWYLIHNEGARPPHQLIVLLALLYGMSMLVRYKPIDWAGMISIDDGSRELIEETIKVCQVKLPALVTEEMLHRRVLGSLEKIPI
jgi:hypothetical protein